MPVPTTEQMIKIWQKATAGSPLQDVPQTIRETPPTSTGRRGGRRTTRKPKFIPEFQEAVEEIQKAKEESGVPPTPLEKKAYELVRPPAPKQVIDVVSKQPTIVDKKTEPLPIVSPEIEKPKKHGTVNINNQTYYLMKYGKSDWRVHDVKGNLISGSHGTKYDANMWIIDPSGKTQITAPTFPSDYQSPDTVQDIGRRMEETPPDKAKPMYESRNYYGTTPTVDKKKAEIFAEKEKGHIIDMELEKKHFIGLDPTTGEPIYEYESPYQVEHGYTPVDPDFKLAVLNLNSDIKDTKSVIGQIKNLIPLARDNLETLDKNLKLVKRSRFDAKFEVDVNADGVIDPGSEIFNKAETLAYIREQKKHNEDIIGYETDIPTYEKQVKDLKNIKGMVEKYKELGYEMDISETGEYSFMLPDAEKVFDWRYGKFAPVQMGASALMQSPFGIETTVDILAGGVKGQKKELAEFGLGIESTLQHRGFGGYAMETYVGSPAMIEGVWTPLGTMALGYGIGGLASKVGTSAGSIGGKLSGALTKFTPTGQKVIKTTYTYGKKALEPFVKTGKVIMPYLATKPGQMLTTGGMFAVIETPGMVEVFERDPSQLPGYVARRGFAWGISIASFKKGMELYKTRHPVKPKDRWDYLPDDEGKFRDITTQKVDSRMSMVQQEVKSDITKFTYSYEGRHPKFKTYDLTGGGYEKVSTLGDDIISAEFKGYQIQVDKEIQILTEHGFKPLKSGESISFGKGLITRTISRGKTTSKVFSFYSIGKEIQTPGIIDPEGIIPRAFVSKTVTTPHGGTPIFTEGRGVFETGYKGVTELTAIDPSLQTIKFAQPSDISKYLFAGKYKPVGFDVGHIIQEGAVSTIKLDAPVKLIPDISKGLLKSKEAVSSLVKPTSKVDYSVLFGVSSSAREIIASLPSTSEMFGKTASKLVTPSINLSTPVVGVITMRSKPEQILPVDEKIIHVTKSRTYLQQTPLIKQITDVGEITEQERKTDIISTTKLAVDIGIEEELLPETGVITDNLLDTKQDQSLRQMTGLRLDLALASQQELSNIAVTTPALNIVTPTPTIQVPIPILPVIEPDGLRTTKRKQILKPKRSGYNVFVKERTMFHGEITRPTRFKKMNEKPLSKRDALSLGGTIVDNTSAISFKIKPTKQKANTLNKPVKNWKDISHKFNKKGDVLIEKTPYRIDTKGEIMGISMLGAKANLLKGSTKKINILKNKGGKKNVRYI